jgi:hypothetical protein
MKINLLDLPATYINLAHQTDRKEQAERELSRWGHLNFSRIEAHYRQPDEWPYAGQNRSYTDACSKHKVPFLQFEDDIILNNNISTVEIPDDADILYIGGFGESFFSPENNFLVDFRAEPTEYENIVKVRHILSNHALVFLSEKMVEEYLNLLREENRADLILCRLSEKYNFYAVQPVIFYQHDTRKGHEVPNSFTRITNYLTGEKFNHL